MAERRMFAQKIIDSDAFLDMPVTAQLLYFHWVMRADDDGFVKNPKTVMRLCSAHDDDVKVLLSKNFVIPFENGVIVIKHWRMQNALRKDRYTPTEYTEQKEKLFLKPNGAYTLNPEEGIPVSIQWQPNGNQMATDGSHSIGKLSKGKVNEGKESNTKVLPKKDKEDTFVDFAQDNVELLEALKDFEQMRKQIKKPLTDKAKKMVCDKLSTFPREQWVAILNQSTMNCWQGLFDLRNVNNNQPSKPKPDMSYLPEDFEGQEGVVQW